MKRIGALVGIVLAAGIAAACKTAPEADGTNEGAATEELNVWAGSWAQADRIKWYTTPQGSHLLDYDVFMNLERAGSEDAFAEANHMRSFGFLYLDEDGEGLTFQPDGSVAKGLPLGVLKDNNRLNKRDYLGLTCSACHTGEVKYKGKRLLVDAAPAKIEFEKFLKELQDALNDTVKDSDKLQRMVEKLSKAPAVAGMTPEQRVKEAAERINELQAHAHVNAKGEVAVDHGPGRLDAVTRILNELMGHHYASKAEGATVAVEVPVSYPHVWDAPRLTCVQTNCLSRNPLSRNTGEVLGVFGESHIDGTMAYGPAQLVGPKVIGTPKVDNLHKLESSLESYWGPKWRPDVFGELKTDLVTAGEKVYDQTCASCHARPWKKSADLYAQNVGISQDELRRMAAKGTAEEKKFVTDNYDTETVNGQVNYLSKVVTKPYKDVGTDPRFIEVHAGRFTNEPAAVQVFNATIKRRIAEELAKIATEDIEVLASSPNAPPLVQELAADPVVQGLLNNPIAKALNGNLQDRLASLAVTAPGRDIYRKIIDRAFDKKRQEQLGLQVRKADPAAPNDPNRDSVMQLLILGATTASLIDTSFEPKEDTREARAAGYARRLESQENRSSTPPLELANYRARPLNGIVYTAPYFHNGSCPDLRCVLGSTSAPKDSKWHRPESFPVRMGTFVPDNGGLDYSGDVKDGEFVLDTSKTANSNKGHTYADKLTEDQKEALLEYLKSL